jgi:UDP-galactopyranose mutase
MPKTKKQTGIKLTKAAEAAIKKEAEAWNKLSLSKQRKVFKSLCNLAEHTNEIALLVALGRSAACRYYEIEGLYKQLLKKQKNK